LQHPYDLIYDKPKATTSMGNAYSQELSFGNKFIILENLSISSFSRYVNSIYKLSGCPLS